MRQRSTSGNSSGKKGFDEVHRPPEPNQQPESQCPQLNDEAAIHIREQLREEEL